MPYAIPVTGTANLSPEHIAQLAKARKSLKKVRRAISVAQFDGWTIAIFGGITLLTGITDWKSVGVGGGLVAIAYVELRAASRLAKMDRDALRVMGKNQLVLACLLIVYAVWQIIWIQRGGMMQELKSLPAEDSLADFIGPAGEMATQLMMGMYCILIAVAIFGQGSLALYYFSRARYLHAYLTETPPWILAMQRRGHDLTARNGRGPKPDQPPSGPRPFRKSSGGRRRNRGRGRQSANRLARFGASAWLEKRRQHPATEVTKGPPPRVAARASNWEVAPF